MGSPRSCARLRSVRTDAYVRPAEAELRGVRLWLLEPRDSAYVSRIETASLDARLSVAALSNVESAPDDASLIGVGPSVSDPLRAARHLRANGSQALLVFFVASPAARNALQAELVRDPFVYPRFEIVELPNNTQQLTTRMRKVVSEIKRRLHIPRTSRLGRTRRRASSSVVAGEIRAEPLLAHVLAQTHDAVLATDESGRVVTWNEAAGRMFGLPSAGTRQRSPITLDRPDQREMAELIQTVLSAGKPLEARVACTGPNAEPGRVLASITPIHDGHGTQLGVSMIVHDDSEYQRVQATLREANRQKDEFLAIMSHELRTPLTSILGYTDMLLRGLSGPLAPVANRYVTNVKAAGDQLLDLVNGLLDYTRVEAGVAQLELRSVDLAGVVQQVVQACSSFARARQLKLELAIPQGLNTTIRADEDRIAHVFRSMLSNALKFTPSGGWVRVTLEAAGEGVRVLISDSGIGMRSEQIERVWEQFYQGDASLTRAYGGMGLGLSIARHLVALHGGSVGAESAGPGLGSTFWFSLPRAQQT